MHQTHAELLQRRERLLLRSGELRQAWSQQVQVLRRPLGLADRARDGVQWLVGQGIADPTATISSMALLLDHLGRRDDAARIEAAVDADVTERGASSRSTTQIGDAIASRLA